MDKNRTDRHSKDTLGPPSVTHYPQTSLRGDLREKLVPFVTELHSHLAQDLEKRTGENLAGVGGIVVWELPLTSKPSRQVR